MPRPKGSTDVKKRKRKVFLTSQQEREIVKDYNKGVPSLNIRNKYSISNAQLSNIRKSRNVKIRINHTDIQNWEIVSDLKSVKGVSGIYAIVFIWNYDDNHPERDYKVNDIKCYIGSSVSIGTRLGSHKNELSKNKHFNKKLQERYHDSEFSIKYAIIERCDEDKVMQKEREYLDKWNRCSLFNTWVATNEKDLRPFLEKAITLDRYSKNFTWSKDKFYNGTPCKESNCVHKNGYAQMEVKIDEERKYFTKHRIAYWEKHGEYPELVRHLCDNPKCYNAEHLAKGNHKDNMLDRRGDFPEKFEKKWLEFQGDVVKLTKEFGWKANVGVVRGGEASASVYEWERKLGIRDKYPDIVEKRIGYQNSYSAEMKDFIRERLDLNTTREIQDQFLEKFKMEVNRNLIYRLGGAQPEPKTVEQIERQVKNKEMYDFIRANLSKYYDWELCVMVNLKFDMLLSLERFLTLRFKKGIYRGGLKPKETLSRKEADMYGGVEYKYFLKENYKLYTDEELAFMVLDEKILVEPYTYHRIQDSKYSMAEFVRRSRLRDFGFLKEGEEAIPSGKDWQTGEPIYVFLLDRE